MQLQVGIYGGKGHAVNGKHVQPEKRSAMAINSLIANY
jgi:hypothetical protein